MQTGSDTRLRLLDAAEKVIREAHGSLQRAVRRITAEADCNVASVSYHFGSLEQLGVATARRVYRRLNQERLAELQAVIDRAAPKAPGVHDILRALIGTSVRWSLDPASPYAVFLYLNRLSSLSDKPEIFDEMVQDITHHRIFADYLGRAAPWDAHGEITWRLAAALGVRSQFTRHADRCAVLTEGQIGALEAEDLIDELCRIIAPMFSRPDQAVRTLAPSASAAGRRSNTV